MSITKIVAFLLLSIILLAILILTLNYFELDEHIHRLLSYIQKAGVTGQVVFATAVTLAVILMLPSAMFTVGAGYIFGVMHGSVLVVLSETLGATIAFLIARYFLSESATQWLRKRASLSHVSNTILTHGWQVIAAFRTIPFFPFKLSNYFFGLFPVKLHDYIFGTFLGLWPITLFNVYLGSLASDVMSTETNNASRSSIQWMVYAAGFFLTLLAVVYLSTLAHKTLMVYRRGIK